MKTAISNMGFNNYADNKPITAKKQQKHRCSKYWNENGTKIFSTAYKGEWLGLDSSFNIRVHKLPTSIHAAPV